jgi:hypothetical protein
MALILACTIVGFLIGFTYVLIKRKIRPGKILAATFLGLLAAGIWKAFRDYNKYNKKFHY